MSGVNTTWWEGQSSGSAWQGGKRGSRRLSNVAKSQAEKWGGWDLNQIFCFSTWPHTALGALEGYILHTHVVCVIVCAHSCVPPSHGEDLTDSAGVGSAAR